MNFPLIGLLLFLPLIINMQGNFTTVRRRDLYRNVTKKAFIINLRIVQGVQAEKCIPYQAALRIFFQNTEEGWCGGSLISNNFVLTAAHCCETAHSIEVILGALNIKLKEKTQVRLNASVIIIHPEWNLETLQNDLCILQLPKIINFTACIRPITLPSTEMSTLKFTNKNAIVSGWGKMLDQAKGVCNILRYITVPIISPAVCNQSYEVYITERHLCTSGTRGESTCNGDSGGPCAVLDPYDRPILLGVTSFGTATCEVREPSVYTCVWSYLGWIKNVTKMK